MTSSHKTTDASKVIVHHSHRNIKTAAFINIGFTFIELIGGVLTNSLALIADAFHDFGDSLVLMSSWTLEKIAFKKQPDWRRSFGYKRLSILSGFLNSVIILGGSVLILIQVIGRLLSPQPIHAAGVIGIAIVGIISNTIGSLYLKSGNPHEKILSWHLFEDVLGWIGILISGIIIYFTGFHMLDPLITIMYTSVILRGIWKNSKPLFNIILEGVPEHKSLKNILKEIKTISEVSQIYDAHFWSLDGKYDIFTAKIITPHVNDAIVSRLHNSIQHKLSQHHILHSTIEIISNKEFVEKNKEQKFL